MKREKSREQGVGNRERLNAQILHDFAREIRLFWLKSGQNGPKTPALFTDK
jgi:hypothetical protein